MHPSLEALFNAVYGPKPEIARAPVGEAISFSAETGERIGEAEAVRQDVRYRLLTYRGKRSGRPDFGKRVYNAFGNVLDERLIRELERVIRLAVAEGSDRYTLDMIEVFSRDEQLYASVTVVPLFALGPVQVDVPVGSLNLS